MLRGMKGLLALALTATAIAAQPQSAWKIVELKGPEGAFSVIPFSVDSARNVYGQIQMNVVGIRPCRWLASTGYTPEVLDTVGGYLRGTNTKGFAAGLREMDGPVGGPSGKPVLWAPDGTFQYLEGLSEYRRAEAIAVNQTKMVVGTTYSISYGGYRPFRWQAGEMLELPTLPDLGHSYGTDINNAGFVVGYGLDNFSAPTKSAGWIWSPTGGLQKLPQVGTYYRANGLNNTGMVCGTARYSGVSAGVVWPLFGTPMILDATPTYPHAEALGVNDNGDLVGNIWSGAWNRKTVLHPVSWIGGVCHDIVAESTLPANATLSMARGINARGDVVGQASYSGHSSGFIAIRRN